MTRWKRGLEQFLNATASFFDRVLRALPIRALRRLETASRRAQGIGWGVETVSSEVQAALSLLPSAVRRGPVTLDIGANVGSWTAALLTAASDAAVYCFEPSTDAFGLLANRFSGDLGVHLVNAAVGDHVGKTQLWSDAPGSELASLSKRRLEHFGIAFGQSEEVRVLTLDSWQEVNPVHPVLLKIDVEGHEMAVLQGATKVLKSVEVVQFEFGGSNIDSRTYFQDFFYFFREAGFRLYRLGPKGLHPVDTYSEMDEAFATTNYFAQRI